VKQVLILFSYLETSWAFEHAHSFNGSPGSHSQLVSVKSSCSLVAFPLSVSLASLCLNYLCSLVSYLVFKAVKLTR